MTFDSYAFLLLFFPVFTAFYYGLRHLLSRCTDRDRALLVMKLYLTAGSLVFFSGFGLRNFLVFAASVAWNTLFAQLLVHIRRDSRTKNITLAAGIAGNVLCLFLFKYVTPFLPVAVSFYTFQGISLLADIFNGELSPSGQTGDTSPKDTAAGLSVTDCLLYLTFFPKLLQGPIVRFREFSVNFDKLIENPAVNDRSSLYGSAARGFILLTLGLSKKALLSEVFGSAVSLGYDRLSSLSGIDCAIVALSYSFQIYLDFSGYSDMAMGICRILQLDLPLNFDRPYTAVSISDFWKRWHISLTRFLTRYIYIPLGGSRVGKARLFLNIMIVFIISGLWHGAGYGFIIWGLMHGLLMAIERVFFRRLTGSGTGSSSENALPGGILLFFRRLFTFLYVTFAWIFFRAPDVSSALKLISGIFTGSYLSVNKDLAICFRLNELWYPLKFTPVAHWDNGAVVCLIAVFVFTAFLIFKGRSAAKSADSWKLDLKHAVLTGLLFGYSCLCLSGVSDFLYLNF